MIALTDADINATAPFYLTTIENTDNSIETLYISNLNFSYPNTFIANVLYKVYYLESSEKRTLIH